MVTPPRHHATTPPLDARRAFTLIELILVLAILAILVAIAIPSLEGVARSQGAKECSGQLMALARYAHTQAIADGVSYRLNIDSAGRRYYLTRQGDGPDFVELGEEIGRDHMFPDGINVEWDNAYALLQQQQQAAQATGQVQPVVQAGAAPYVEFYPSGRTDPAAIRITDRAGNITEMACLSATETFRLIGADGQIKQ
jgi:type II secretion system protein H